jgi:hypothetical protein
MSRQAFYDPDLSEDLLPEPSLPTHPAQPPADADADAVERPEHGYRAYIDQHGLAGQAAQANGHGQGGSDEVDEEEVERERREALESVPEDVRKVSVKTSRDDGLGGQTERRQVD